MLFNDNKKDIKGKCTIELINIIPTFIQIDHCH